MGALQSLMAGLSGVMIPGDRLSFNGNISVKNHVPGPDCPIELTANSPVSLHESFPCGHKRQDRKSINFERDCFPRGEAKERKANIWPSADEWSEFLERFK